MATVLLSGYTFGNCQEIVRPVSGCSRGGSRTRAPPRPRSTWSWRPSSGYPSFCRIEIEQLRLMNKRDRWTIEIGKSAYEIRDNGIDWNYLTHRRRSKSPKKHLQNHSTFVWRVTLVKRCWMSKILFSSVVLNGLFVELLAFLSSLSSSFSRSSPGWLRRHRTNTMNIFGQNFVILIFFSMQNKSSSIFTL